MKITEETRVKAQNARARARKTVATLTLTEWEQTIADFHGMCAYCNQHPFTALEHFIPFGQEGDGTHVRNCLPACQPCNNIKKNRNVEVIIEKFGKELIERLQTYLANRSHQDDIKPKFRPKLAPEPKREKPAAIPVPSDVPYLTLEEAAGGLAMSIATIRKYIKDLSVPVHKLGRSKHAYITKQDYDSIVIAKQTPWKIPVYREDAQQSA